MTWKEILSKDQSAPLVGAFSAKHFGKMQLKGGWMVLADHPLFHFHLLLVLKCTCV